MTISRRSFLKSTATTAAVAAAGGSLTKIAAKSMADVTPGPGNKWPGRVAFNFNKGAVDTSGKVDETVVKQMVDDAIKVLTGESEVGAAWKAVFPSTLSATSKIAVKTNMLNAGKPCPHASSVQAITDGLLKMDIGGAKLSAANITIYDMNNSNSFSSAGYDAGRFPGMKLVHLGQPTDSNYGASDFGDGALNNRAYAKTLKDADFLINVFSPRGHFLGGKVTLGFKSHYGTYSSPSGMHNNADVALPEINCSGPVFAKTVLSVCSGIFGMNESNGPTGSADDYSTYVKSIDKESTTIAPSTIILSTDPVSCDMQAFKLMRLNKANGKYGISDMPAYLKAAAGVSGAKFNIGVIDESQMDIRRIINGVVEKSGVGLVFSGKAADMQNRLQATHLKNQHTMFIEYALPQSYIGSTATISLHDIKGSLVFSTNHHVGGLRNHFSWNERNMSGGRVPNGAYIVRIAAGAVSFSQQVTIVK